MANFAVIDVGTNTLILLIARLKGKKIEPLHDEAVITRLGQGLTDNHFFSSEAMNRTRKVLVGFKKKCDELKVKKIAAVGTAACRIAANAKVFVDAVKKETGVKIDIISPDEEANCTFQAALSDFGGKQKLIVVDIGGGSTEIVTGPLNAKKTPESVMSLTTGSVRLTEQYIHSDPINSEDFNRLHIGIRNGLTDDLDGFYPNTDFSGYQMVATAGTATTLAALDKKMARYNPTKIHGSKLKKKNLEDLIARLVPLSVAERQKLPGIEPLRADVILSGALLLNEIMRYFKQETTLISDRGLRYGIFLKRFAR
ncbi:MAG: hypothetical protein Q7T11_08660 [Deltaproteobacteria bacterium]|nr:hypothetical protein [Deltaproteobacteria bacterium]